MYLLSTSYLSPPLGVCADVNTDTHFEICEEEMQGVYPETHDSCQAGGIMASFVFFFGDLLYIQSWGWPSAMVAHW